MPCCFFQRGKILNTLRKVKEIYQDDFLSPLYTGGKKISHHWFQSMSKQIKIQFALTSSYLKMTSFSKRHLHRSVQITMDINMFYIFLCSLLVMRERMAKPGWKIKLGSIPLSEHTSLSTLFSNRNHLHSIYIPFIALRISMVSLTVLLIVTSLAFIKYMSSNN